MLPCSASFLLIKCRCTCYCSAYIMRHLSGLARLDGDTLFVSSCQAAGNRSIGLLPSIDSLSDLQCIQWQISRLLVLCIYSSGCYATWSSLALNHSHRKLRYLCKPSSPNPLVRLYPKTIDLSSCTFVPPSTICLL